jgi:hypothetical protein
MRIFDAQVYESIRSAYVADQQHARHNRRQIQLPSAEVIQHLVDECFAASLKTEEGSHVSFSACLVPRGGPPRDEALLGVHTSILEFETPVPLSAENLVKLSPSFDPEFSALLVSLEANHTYLIWGAAFYRGFGGRFASSNVGIEGFIAHRPDVPTITCESVGALTLSRGMARIGHLLAGCFEMCIPTPLTANEFGTEIRRRLEGTPLLERYGNYFWWLYRDSLSHLLQELVRRTHGATVVVLGTDLQDVTHEGLINPGHIYHGALGLGKLLERIMAASTQRPKNMTIEQLESMTLDDNENHRLIRERLEFLAQQAAMDGALIVNQELEPLAVGSKLLAPQNPGATFIGYGSEEFELKRFGTRHSSAAGFAISVPSSFTFVRSSDGPVRGFAVDDSGQLRCWPDCLQSVFMN